MIKNSPDNPGAVIVDGHGHTDLGVARALGRSGVSVYLVTNDPEAPVARSRYIKKRFAFPPNAAPEADKIAALEAIGKQFQHRPVLFSTGDGSLMLLSRNRGVLERHYLHHLAEQDVVEQLNDKRLFAKIAEELDLPVPRTLVPEGRGQLEEALPRLVFPVIVKPAEKHNWARHPHLHKITGGNLKGVRLESPEELLWFYDEVCPFSTDMVIQEYIEGRDEALYSLYAYLSREQALKGWALSQKIRTNPPHRGVATVSVTRDDRAIYDLGRRALLLLGVTGMAILQVKWSPAHQQYLILEVNARHGTSISLYPEAGVNLPYAAYLDSLGREVAPLAPQREGVRWIDLANDLRAMRRYRALGEWTWAGMLQSYLGHRTYAVFDWTDPAPALAPLWQRVHRKSARVAGRLSSLAKR